MLFRGIAVRAAVGQVLEDPVAYDLGSRSGGRSKRENGLLSSGMVSKFGAILEHVPEAPAGKV